MNTPTEPLSAQLQTLPLRFIREPYAALAQQAAAEQWPPVDYLARLVEGELQRRQDRALERRLKAARLPLLKTLEQFQWNWPKKINRLQVQQVFRLQFLDSHTHVIFLGGVGLGKTHLAIALAYTTCLAGSTVLFTTAVDAVNTLIAAQAAGRLKTERNR